jgi:L-lactate dehydrogenase complex protein LldE
MSARPITLIVPCLVDQVCPEIGIAVVLLLRRLGFDVRYDPGQICCGQPAFNCGDQARQVAISTLNILDTSELAVCPSGSCTSMIRNYYPRLFEDQENNARAHAASTKIFEFGEFLEQHASTTLGTAALSRARYKTKAAFHNSCHSARELHNTAPQSTLSSVKDCEWVDFSAEPVCCGFGGLFCAKFPAIAGGMARSRLEYFLERGASVIVSNDPGCIVHLRTEAQVAGLSLEVLHSAEFLCRALDLPLDLNRSNDAGAAQ